MRADGRSFYWWVSGVDVLGKNMMGKLILIFLLCIIAEKAYAEEHSYHTPMKQSSMTLLEDCKSEESAAYLFCLGYLNGFIDASSSFCIPASGISIRQGILIFLKYADLHPEELHLDANIVVYRALRQAFPCK